MTVESVSTTLARLASETPEACAIIDSVRRLSYVELDAEANQLARHLETKGLRDGDRVAVLLEPSVDLAVTWLALWRIGAAAVPLDPAAPPRRLARIIGDAGCRIAITLSQHADLMRPLAGCVVHLDAERAWIATQSGKPSSLREGERLACIFYTSGSTGEPKGVPLSTGVLNEKFARQGAWGALDARCRSLWHSSAAFDASLSQVFLPLVNGGCVRALGHAERLDPRRLWRLAAEHQATHIDGTPSWMAAMAARPVPLPTLRRLVLGGEAFSPALARRLRALFPQAQLVNVYGPTEACIDATAHEIADDDLQGASIPIGRALDGYRIVLLDESGRHVTAGGAGEICIGGFGLAEGYWNRPALTAAAFISDPADGGARLYRSGDLGHVDAAGRLCFAGRTDQQIKLRGQRIELQEVESVLLAQPGVASAAVKLWPEGVAGEPILVGYVVIAEAGVMEAVRARLARELPPSHAPALLVQLAAMPLTVTGKIDRNALPEPPARTDRAPALEPAAGSAEAEDLEGALLQLWRGALGSNGLSRHDNFFEWGGDSLTAVTLALQIGECLNLDVPATLLLEFPTVADAADALTRRRLLGRSRRVLELSTKGARPPLFLLPPGTGIGLVYAGLARELANVQPCIALQAVGLPGAPATMGMTELATHFLADVERLHPAGPVHLCGYSAGGAVAHEMIRQLARRGRAVERLVLLDPYCADGSDCPDGVDVEGVTAGFWSACREMIGDAFGLRDQAAEPLLAAARELWAEMEGGAASKGELDQPMRRRLQELLPPTADPGLFMLLLEGVANIFHAYYSHGIERLSDYRGSALMIQPDGDAAALREARLGFWRTIIGPQLEGFVVPGEHPTMLQRAQSLARIGSILRMESGGGRDHPHRSGDRDDWRGRLKMVAGEHA